VRCDDTVQLRYYSLSEVSSVTAHLDPPPSSSRLTVFPGGLSALTCLRSLRSVDVNRAAAEASDADDFLDESDPLDHSSFVRRPLITERAININTGGGYCPGARDGQGPILREKSILIA